MAALLTRARWWGLSAEQVERGLVDREPGSSLV
jgi:hypothetical protein